MDLNKFYDITLERLLEVAKYQKARCGKIKNLGKEAQADVDDTSTHSALTYMDMFTQDYLMVPIFQEFPDLVPVVEETTGMKLQFQDNKSDDVLIMDPVDGTAIYCAGEKDYSIMVGLLNKGNLVLGMGCYPETNEVYAAIKGKGAWKTDSDGNKLPLRPLSEVKFDEKNVAAHYRFLKEPFKVLSDRLKKNGYQVPTNFAGFGTCLSGILRITDGKSSAFIGPHMSLHDFGVGAFIVQELGGVIRIFDYQGKNDTENWTKTDNQFTGLDPKGTNPRFRVIIANNDSTVDKLIKDMYQ